VTRRDDDARGGEVRFLSLCGMLGYGYPQASLARGLAARPAFIGVDAGSTDPGPYYLGSGRSFVSAMQVERDLEPALCAARRLGIPLVVGSAGGSGARPHLEATVEQVRKLAARHELHFRLAVIPADLEPDTLLEALRDGRVQPCGPAGELTAERVRACTHLVGQMGTGPLVRALDGGADVVLAARCCDTAIFAALPILRGCDPALALHLAKIAECGALCARPAAANDALVGILRHDHFVVEPANPARRCTPESVAMHSLYEQPDPTCFHEPEGTVDLSACTFEPCGERGVRVAGTRLVPPERPTIKVEGAALRGYRAVAVAGVRDPAVIAHLDAIEHAVRASVADALAPAAEPAEYSLRFLRYGLDGVLGHLEPAAAAPPTEVGLVLEAVAATQELADTALALARSTALHQHFPGRKTTAGNLAFPFSPSDLRGGPVYEFAVYHLMAVAEPDALFPVTFQEV